MIYEYLEEYTYENLLQTTLNTIPDNIDKRQGSIIYDALAPACLALSEVYAQLRDILISTYAETSYGEFLDLRVQERGISRFAATKAVRLGTFEDENGEPVYVPLGNRFSTINAEESVNFIVTGVHTEEGQTVQGSYQLTCEEFGTIGNGYVGDLLPLDNISGLSVAEISTILTPAQNEETDEELRERYFSHLRNQSFGGNVSQYNDILQNLDGISSVQVYPVWDGGGTVKCSIISGSYRAVSNEFIAAVQEQIDPQGSAGEGVGIAPIGHTVSIVTPTELAINISATIALMNDYTLSQVTPGITEALESYMLELRQDWGTESTLNEYALSVFRAKIMYAILNITGVANVTNVTINGQDADLTLTETAELQQLPVLGEVTLNE